MTYEFERLFNLSLDLLCVASVDGYFRRVNPAFCRVLGWSEDQLLDRPFFDYVHEDDVAATRAELERLTAGLPTDSFENRYRCSDGTFRHLAWTAFPETQTGLVYAVGRDITGARLVEQRVRAALESSPSGMVLVDRHARIVMVNKETERLFGYDSSELLGQPVELLIPDELRAAHERHRGAFLSNPEPRPMGFRRDLVGQRKDGSEFPVEVGLNPLETDEGKFVISSIVDLTARKEAEASREKLIVELQQALSEIKALRGLIPICSHCKKIRDDGGAWQRLESYISQRSEAEFSHGICPECGPKYYGEHWKES
jgi:PAS domain S-box-containing protein